LDGIIVKIYKDGEEVREVRHPSNLRMEWDEVSAR